MHEFEAWRLQGPTYPPSEGAPSSEPLTGADLILAEMERKRHFERDFYENVLEPHVKVLMKRLHEWNMEYLQKKGS